MKVVYVGPFDAVEVEGRVFARGVPEDVTPELAGRPPSKRLAEIHAELVALHEGSDRDHARIAGLQAEAEHPDFDRGAGLLAQDVWALPREKAAQELKAEEAPK